MRLIAHRGNLNGKIERKENTIEYIEGAISQGYDVEIDVRFAEGELWLGHDAPCEKLDPEWLDARWKYLWVHCKDLASIQHLRMSNLNYFGHDNDDFVLTSKGYIFCKPTPNLDTNCVMVMPEYYNYKYTNEKCFAILTDFPKRFVR